MRPIQKTVLMTAAAAGLAIAAMAPAHADAFAQSILVIDNFRLLHSNGTPFTSTDFSQFGGTNQAGAGGQWNGAFASGALSLSGNADVLHQAVGTGPAPRAENDFTPFAGLPAAFGNFGYADQNMSGSLITNTVNPAGATFQTRADAALTMGGSAWGLANLSSSTSFSFALGAGEHMTIAFNANPFSQAYASQGGSASAAMSWSMRIVDISTGTTVFSYQPDQLNSLGKVVRSDGLEGASTYDPGALFFNATTDVLTAGDIYQLVIEQSNTSDALQPQAIPEPATLAICGFGLLGMAALGRRRRR
jgi:hypothetical protein